LSAPSSSQGSLLLLEVRSRRPFVEVTAEWNSKNVPFWQVTGKATDSSNLVADMRAAITRKEEDIAAIKRELAKLPQ